MQTGRRSSLLISAGLFLTAILSGCGGSNNQAIPATVTVINSHTAILRGYSSVMTTGYNGFGQLGNGNLTSQSSLTRVNTTGRIDKVATGGAHTVAVSFANLSSIYVWGSNYHGQIGSIIPTTGSGAYSATPAKVNFPGHVTDVAAGAFHTLTIVNDTGSGTLNGGNVYAIGYNGYGQLGDNTYTDNGVPVEVKDVNGAYLSHIVQVAAGGGNSLALASNGHVYAWGDNAYGQLGVDPTSLQATNRGYADLVQVTDPNNPSAKIPLDNVIQIAAGGSTSFALKADGTVWAWGYNGMGQLGIDPYSTVLNYSYTPVQVDVSAVLQGGSIVQIAAGLDHVLALTSTGYVIGWGFNDFGQAGSNNNASGSTGATDKARVWQPVNVLWQGNGTPGSGVPMSGVTQIIAFGKQSLAAVGGTIVGGTQISQNLIADPASPLFNKGVQIGGGLINGATWYGWGDNGNGQLGYPVSNTAIGYQLVPVKVGGF